MSQTVELNQGEIKVNFSSPTSGKLSFADLGLSDTDLVFEGGLVRLVFDFEGIGEHTFFQMPTISISYAEEMTETHWQCDFNKVTILDKTDHHGRSTVLLLNRNKMGELEQHHKNALIVHGEFPQAVHVSAKDSFVTFFN